MTKEFICRKVTSDEYIIQLVITSNTNSVKNIIEIEYSNSLKICTGEINFESGLELTNNKVRDELQYDEYNSHNNLTIKIINDLQFITVWTTVDDLSYIENDKITMDYYCGTKLKIPSQSFYFEKCSNSMIKLISTTTEYKEFKCLVLNNKILKSGCNMDNILLNFYSKRIYSILHRSGDKLLSESTYENLISRKIENIIKLEIKQTIDSNYIYFHILYFFFVMVGLIWCFFKII